MLYVDVLGSCYYWRSRGQGCTELDLFLTGSNPRENGPYPSEAASLERVRGPCTSPGQQDKADLVGRDTGQMALRAWEWEGSNQAKGSVQQTLASNNIRMKGLCDLWCFSTVSTMRFFSFSLKFYRFIPGKGYCKGRGWMGRGWEMRVELRFMMLNYKESIES